MSIRTFMKTHYKHFNAAVCREAAEAYREFLKMPGKMLMSLAGAMSTAELGISLAEMIRKDKVHAISCSGANLEEDIFNLVAHRHYLRVPHYRSLNKKDEEDLLQQGFNRVTDTCIPEETAFRKVEKELLHLWQHAEKRNERYFPFEFIYQLLDLPKVQKTFEIDPLHSWVYAAKEKRLPIFSPGWEDSTLGNVFVSHVIKRDLKDYQTVKSGPEQMGLLVDWYRKESAQNGLGFFQIGGGIAGDFAICVVPLLRQDLRDEVPLWGYFCQISDSTTSYGSYSGAVPNEKITWGKLSVDTPSFLIESDATIVAPLIFSAILE